MVDHIRQVITVHVDVVSAMHITSLSFIRLTAATILILPCTALTGHIGVLYTVY